MAGFLTTLLDVAAGVVLEPQALRMYIPDSTSGVSYNVTRLILKGFHPVGFSLRG
jgi:hypothetical protein